MMADTTNERLVAHPELDAWLAEPVTLTLTRGQIQTIWSEASVQASTLRINLSRYSFLKGGPPTHQDCCDTHRQAMRDFERHSLHAEQLRERIAQIDPLVTMLEEAMQP